MKDIPYLIVDSGPNDARITAVSRDKVVDCLLFPHEVLDLIEGLKESIEPLSPGQMRSFILPGRKVNLVNETAP